MKKQNKKLAKKTTHKKKPSVRNGLLRRARYLPALVISLFASFLWMQPYLAATLRQHTDDVLAYATNISPAGLLSATNSRRTANGAPALKATGLLASAAQSKANHMVSNDYWSHVAPDGTQPWWFITNAGYQYLSAGENLAYGFMTSADTVTGWMNSASHRANMLNSTFTEVGFGIANSQNYTGKGPQTIVVAMYAKPQAAPAPVQPQSTKPAAPQTQPATTKKTVQTPPADKQEASQKEEAAPAEEKPAKEPVPEEEPIAIAETDTTTTAAPTKVSRVQLLTGGSAIWSATFVVLAVLSVGFLWLLHKGFHIKRYLKAGERFIAHHLYLDLTIVAVIYLGFVLLTTTGTIK